MKKAILICVGTIVIIAAWGLFRFKSAALSIEKPIVITLDRDDQVDSVIHCLKAYNLKSPWLMAIIADKMHMQNGLKQGRYTITPNMTYVDICRVFREGKFKSIDFTIKPMIQLQQVQKLYGLKFEGDSLEMADCMKDSLFLKTLGFNDTNLFALMLPNTYNMLFHSSAQEVLGYLQKQYHQFWDSSKINLAKAQGLTPIQVSTLASIVAKESNQAEEMPMIAGMYLNRLRIGMPLQADPTIKFALKMPGLKRILNIHLAVESPYNTYLYKGLPPGPICSPSLEAIKAVLNPAQHQYLFMCAKADFSGYHVFASNYKAHLKNANLYQKALDANQIH